MDNFNNFILSGQKSGEMKKKNRQNLNTKENKKKDLPQENDQVNNNEEQNVDKSKEITMETILSHFIKTN